jgi:hypothetical protein
MTLAKKICPAFKISLAYISFRYYDQSVLNFMQKFKQNGLLDKVNLLFAKLPTKNILQPVLCHILPLVNDIVSIYVHNTQLIDLYDAENRQEIYELTMKMMEETRVLGVR